MVNGNQVRYIKNILLKEFPDEDGKKRFVEMPLKEKHEFISNRVSDEVVSDDEIKAFLHYFSTAVGGYGPLGGRLEDRKELGPVATSWHKPNPPLTELEFMDEGHHWQEEFLLVTEVASNLDFESAQDPHLIALEVLDVFGIGGYEDFRLPGTVASSNEDDGTLIDDTMSMIVRSVRSHLSTLRPWWFDENGHLRTTLDKGDPRSLTEINREAEKQIEKERKERSRERRGQSRQEYREKMAEEESSSAAVLSRYDATEVMPFLFDMTKKELRGYFRDEKKESEYKTWLNYEAMAVVGDLMSRVENLVVTEDTAEKYARAAFKRAIKYVEQFILGELAAHHPGWFVKTQAGNWTFSKDKRRSKEQVQIAAIRKSVQRIVDKHKDLTLVRKVVADLLGLEVTSANPVLSVAQEADEPEPPAPPVAPPPLPATQPPAPPPLPAAETPLEPPAPPPVPPAAPPPLPPQNPAPPPLPSGSLI